MQLTKKKAKGDRIGWGCSSLLYSGLSSEALPGPGEEPNAEVDPRPTPASTQGFLEEVTTE